MNPIFGQSEVISRVTPLGIRFWDPLTGHTLCDGLQVTAHPLGEPSRRTTAKMNRSGIYFLQDLPGIRELEFGSGDRDYWTGLSKKSFIVEVTDPQRRFQSFAFQAELPHQGLLTNPCLPASPLLASPLLGPADELGIPLYSAITRGVPSGMAVIYAKLWDATNQRSASWAMLEASWRGTLLSRTFADRDGQVALLFPYPQMDPPVSSPPGSPPADSRTRLADRTWQIDLQVFYALQSPVPELPDLCQILDQPPAALKNTVAPDSPLDEIQIHFGQEYVLRSASKSTALVVP
jgi:hypothetical protein